MGTKYYKQGQEEVSGSSPASELNKKATNVYYVLALVSTYGVWASAPRNMVYNDLVEIACSPRDFHSLFWLVKG